MAQGGIQLDWKDISCSICLNLLKNPVTIPCGHNYCMNCIKIHWAQDYEKNIYSCPQCRRSFTPRPVLGKNNLLAILVEEKKNMGHQAAPAHHSYLGPEVVFCDICTGSKLKASKSCLVCLVSYCEEHLQPHYQVAPLKKHQLVEPSNSLLENICPRHDEVLKMFCCTDQQRICYLCSVEEHKDHQTVTVATERAERQKYLTVCRHNIQLTIQDRQKILRVLQQEVESISRLADKVVEDTENTFMELICIMESKIHYVKQQVRSQQETEVRKIIEIQQNLEREIAELKMKDVKVEELSRHGHLNDFLQSYILLSAFTQSPPTSYINIRPLKCFEAMTAAVSKASDRLQDVLKQEWMNVSLTKEVPLPSASEPKTRAEFLKYSRDITLDSNTVHKDLLLSEADSRVTFMGIPQVYFSHPQRFTDMPQVLSRESLTGRCYWEVERRGRGVHVVVAYKNMSRGGDMDESWFGFNDKSWALYFDSKKYDFYHNGINTPVLGPLSTRVGVFLDHTAGILSFYSISDSFILLHRVQTQFTQPLYAGFGLEFESSAKVCRSN